MKRNGVNYFQLAEPSLLDLGIEDLKKEVDWNIRYNEGELFKCENSGSDSIVMPIIKKKLGKWIALKKYLTEKEII